MLIKIILLLVFYNTANAISSITNDVVLETKAGKVYNFIQDLTYL